MRRFTYVGVVAFIAVAFIVAALSGGTGLPFLVSLSLGAGMLIVLVFLAAFPGGFQSRRNRGGDFGSFEEATRRAARGLLLQGRSPELRDSGSGVAADHATRAAAHEFVKTLVPVPTPPPAFPPQGSNRVYLNALRAEGSGLIKLAKVIGVDVAPYGEFLADARTAALQGDAEATVRSLELANELLRGTAENFLVKRRSAGHAPEDSWGL